MEEIVISTYNKG